MLVLLLHVCLFYALRNPAMAADPHFARDTHMRIILGNSGSAVGRSPTSILSSQPPGDFTNATSGGRYV